MVQQQQQQAANFANFPIEFHALGHRFGAALYTLVHTGHFRNTVHSKLN